MYNYIWKENQHKAKINMCYLWKKKQASNHSKNGSFKNYHFVKISQNSKSRAKESRIECVLITQCVMQQNVIMFPSAIPEPVGISPRSKTQYFWHPLTDFWQLWQSPTQTKWIPWGSTGQISKKEGEGGEVTLGGQLHRRSAPEVEIWGGGNPIWVGSAERSNQRDTVSGCVRQVTGLMPQMADTDTNLGHPKEQKPASGQIRRRRLAKHVFLLRQTSGEQVVRGGLALNGGHQTDANLGPDWPVTHIATLVEPTF